MSGHKLLIATALVTAVFTGPAYSGDDSWFFAPNEIANAHRYQQQFGARLRHPLKPEDCSYGQTEFPASYQGKPFAAPCRFIAETIRQLRELLESGAARYLFPLDVDHADFGVPLDVWNNKYDKLPRENIFPALLHEPTLIAVYHTAQHLFPVVSKPNSGTSIWGQRRTVIGFYDGRRTEVLQPRSDGTVAYKPEGFHWLGGLTLMSHYLGELQFIADETVVMFDMSFDDDRAEGSNHSVVNMSARPK
jgi:hypothetical protein